MPGDRFTTPEFAQRLAAISTDLQQPVCAYINRRGQVIRVGVGTPHQTQIPLLELPRYGAERLCGIRCLATDWHDTAPKNGSLTAMAIQRLDALVVLALTGSGFERRGGGATGYVGTTYLAHLVPQTDPDALDQPQWYVSPPQSLEALAKQDFLALVASLEEEFRREYVAQQVDASHDRVLLVGVQTESRTAQQFATSLAELARLVDTAGGEVLQTLQQRRSRPHPQTVIGAGKVEELALAVQTLGITTIVFDRDLSPAQARNLEARCGARVVDRTEVILDIFAQRAQSRAGKLQVELAQLEYMLPRLTGRGQAMSRLGGGIGTRGPGETKLETERRAIGRRLARLQREVNELQAHRSRLRQQRQHREMTSIAIVGYTNAGKSTLLNALTSADAYAADQLFATLDPTTRRLPLTNPATGETQTVLLTDTVGFIQDLPPALVDAFRATLEEVTEADALLHVVDLSHPAWPEQIAAVKAILADMAIAPGPMLLAFNKLDAAPGEALTAAKERFPEAAFVAARQRLGLATLRDRLSQLVLQCGR